MKIETKYFGEIEAAEGEIITFKKGLFGFEQNNSFVIIPFDETDEASFLCLQSTDESDLAFVLFNPFYLDSDYNPKLAAEDSDELEIGENTIVTFLAVTVIRESFPESTVNMKCPLVINRETNNAKQVILEHDYPMRKKLGFQTMEGA